ncbi:NUDIX hydrolase domain-like protein, partial [Cantharellus anzutake]|uniref:NUDIX hydrolase domain-like protein n=1 Tax=Cantharellus anzutake TaxID=1750568 RepID=UPI001906C916
RCLQTLAGYKLPSPPDPIYPLSRSAAVLVALFVGRNGDLYVLLSRRAETLRSFPGDTSLPGGRFEPGDRNLEDTARREAFEEIGLPQDRYRIPLLCYLQPFLIGTHLLVTPVVVLILDPEVRPILNEPEVSALFSHPLHAFLLRDAPFARYHLPHSEAHPHSPNFLARHLHIAWGQSKVRMHKFLTGREDLGVKPVTGLTAAILLHTAMVGYQKEPEFLPHAPGELSQQDRIAYALRTIPVFTEAVKRAKEELDIARRGRLPKPSPSSKPIASPAPPRALTHTKYKL